MPDTQLCDHFFARSPSSKQCAPLPSSRFCFFLSANNLERASRDNANDLPRKKCSNQDNADKLDAAFLKHHHQHFETSFYFACRATTSSFEPFPDFVNCLTSAETKSDLAHFYHSIITCSHWQMIRRAQSLFTSPSATASAFLKLLELTSFWFGCQLSSSPSFSSFASFSASSSFHHSSLWFAGIVCCCDASRTNRDHQTVKTVALTIGRHFRTSSSLTIPSAKTTSSLPSKWTSFFFCLSSLQTVLFNCRCRNEPIVVHFILAQYPLPLSPPLSI